MRKQINIVWLEDDMKSPGYKDRKEIVDMLLKEKGYESNIIEKQSFQEAEKILETNTRIDFFITDFNISDENNTGLTYLKMIRKKSSYKQFIILYSNNEYSVIRDDVKEMLNTEKIDVFSNFTFFSLGDNRDIAYFKQAIDVILCRWDELNAIRGRYMCENAEIEYLLRSKLNQLTSEVEYKKLVYQFKNSITNSAIKKNKKLLFENWIKMIDKRNSLAHTKEGYDDSRGFYIKSLVNEDYSIYEDSLDSERKSLVELKKEIVTLLEDYRKMYC